jgi:hypothetical protein
MQGLFINISRHVLLECRSRGEYVLMKYQEVFLKTE